MISRSIKNTWRNVRNNRNFAYLNIFSLSIGVACFFLLVAYIVHELSYDRFYQNADRIAYVSFGYKTPNENDFTFSGTTPTAVAPLLGSEFTEVEKAVRIYHYNGQGIITSEGSQSIKEQDMKFVDEDFFDVIHYPFIAGNIQGALSKPYQIVLTKSFADKHFPQENPIGKSIIIDNQPWLVTGVIQDPPSYTQLPFQALLSNKHLERYKEQSWSAANDITLALLKSPHDFRSLDRKINNYIQNRFADMINSGFMIQINIEKLQDVHLYSKIGTGNLLYIYIFSALALSIILISSLNFTNLAITQAIDSAKEISVKKVLGASRFALFCQSLLQNSFTIIIAVVIGLALATLILPSFSYYIGSEIQLNIWTSPLFYLGTIFLTIFICLLAASWPALVISGFQPIQTLKGKIFGPKYSNFVSKGLIGFQLGISTLFILCTLVINRQLHYIQTKDTGLDRSGIIVVDGDLFNDADRTSFKHKLLASSSIQGVSASYDSPVNIKGGYTIKRVEGKGSDFQLSVTAIPIEQDFLSVFDIPIIAGTHLSDADILRAQDTSTNRHYSFIVNQKLLTTLDLQPNEAIGRMIELNGRKGRISTVVDNFNFASLKEEVGPVVLFPEYNYFGNIFIKINAGSNMSHAFNVIEQAWKEIKPNSPFDFHFLDDDYAKLYQQEQQTSKAMRLFSFITIGTACMGLFALSAFQAKKRIKEIGIRKVLGASNARIIRILSQDFLSVIVVALIIAMPIAWSLMLNWLKNFAFRIELEWWVFILGITLTFIVTLLTISTQAFRAARANPVDSLRDE